MAASSQMQSPDNQFLEGLVFAEDRIKALDELLPKGSEDWYFYRLLTLQSAARGSTKYKAAEYKVGGSKMLAATIDTLQQNGKAVKNYRDSPRIKNLLLRQALIDFYNSTGATRRQTIVRVKNLLNPRLDHGKKLKKKGGAEPGQYPSSLNLSTAKLMKKKWDAMNLSKQHAVAAVFTEAAKDFLGAINLSNTQIGYFLELLDKEAPEAPYLLTHIKKDLEYNETPFGDRGIHYRLTKNQLDLLGKKSERLNSSQTFLEAYAWKLAPISDANLRDNLEARGKYLTNLKKFVRERVDEKVCPSLAAIILYNWMIHQERFGKYDKNTFMKYLAIPKPDNYYNAKVCVKQKGEKAALDYSIERIPCLDPIGDDEPYVCRAFRYFFKTTELSPSSFKGKCDQDYLKPLFAETRLLKGSREKAIKELYNSSTGSTIAFEELQARVDIELLPVNKQFYNAADPVTLRLNTKNVPRLTVRVYEINATNYYTAYKQEVTPDIGVDGMAPFVEIRKEYTDPEIVSRERTINIPQLKNRRGIFLLDFLGNGQQARALIRKGELRYIARQEFSDDDNSGDNSYVFRIFNEMNQEVRKGSVWVDGTEYATDKQGRAFVPFAKADNPREPIILDDKQRPGSATLHFFARKTENFRMAAGLFVDRESLLEKQIAKAVVRPALFLNEEPCSVAFLSRPEVSITTENEKGEKVTKVVSVALGDNRETVVKFTVPTELREVTITLAGDVTRGSCGTVQRLSNSETFKVNEIDNTPFIGDLHLIPRGAAGYALASLGKNGEPLPSVVVRLQLKHRYFQKKLSYTLETNEDGLLFLGRLPDVLTVEARAKDDRCYVDNNPDIWDIWNLLEDKVNVPPIVNVKAGGIVRIPFMSVGQPGPKIGVYDANFNRDFKNASFRNGYVIVKGLPVGDFEIFIRDQQYANVRVHVAGGMQVDNYVVSSSRIVELSEDVPLQICDVKGTREKGYKVQLEGFNKNTRLHAISTFLCPRFTAYGFLAAPCVSPSVYDFRTCPAIYTEQVAVDQEFAYVLARQGIDKAVGNLLSRPSLLVSSWSSTGAPPKQLPADIPPIDEAPPDTKISLRYDRVAKTVHGAVKREYDDANLEFLAQPSVICENLTASPDGWVTLPGEAIEQNLVTIIAVDDNNTCLRNVILPEAESMYRNITLQAGLDPSKRFAENREIVLLNEPGDTLNFVDWATTTVETFDDLSDVFELFRCICHEQASSGVIYNLKETLLKFEFITTWCDLTKEEKLAYYDTFMSNELNFFIYKKDLTFFNDVVKKYIQDKISKSFFDLFLLEDKSIGDYVELAKYATLNAFEKILLASRVKSLGPTTLRYIQEAAALQFDDLSGNDRLFQRCMLSKQLTVQMMDSFLEENPASITLYDRCYKVVRRPDLVREQRAPWAPNDNTEQREETGYYNVPFADTTSELFDPNRFWADYAFYCLSRDKKPRSFLSKFFGWSSNNLSEMLLCMSVLDLPFRSQVKGVELTLGKDGSASIKVTNPTILLSKQIKETPFQSAALSVSTNYFDPQKQWEMVDGEQVDRFLKMPLVTGKVYGSRIVITNVSSMQKEVEVLAQIPTGSVPVSRGFRTKNFLVTLPPYKTVSREFYFYFPSPGDFAHFPAHVHRNTKVIGYGMEDPTVNVVDPEQLVDTSSWYYMSQLADQKELLGHLKRSPDLQGVALSDIAWRMKDEKFFIDVTTVLRNRQVFDEEIWAYSMQHFAAKELTEYLALSKKFAEFLKPHFDKAQIVGYDGFYRLGFQYTEFWPLGMQRAHGAKLENEAFKKQYNGFLNRACYRSFSRSSIRVDDKLALCGYLLLQGRIKEAMGLFKIIDPAAAKTCSEFNYDYTKAYLSFYSGDINAIQEASNLADAYLQRPLTPSNMNLWQSVADQLAEIKDPTNDGGVFSEPVPEPELALDAYLTDDRQVVITASQISSITVNFYKIDLELKFSVSPFQQTDNSFNYVTPNESLSRDLTEVSSETRLRIPETLRDATSVVEIVGTPLAPGPNLNIALTDYENQLDVQTSEGLGQVRVLNSTSQKPVSKAYVKVYGRNRETGLGDFYKDGYTDLRGRFDYTTVHTDKSDDTDKFAILVATESAGSTVIELDN